MGLFVNNVCSYTDITTNRFGGGKLEYSSSAITGAQNHSGNRFTGITSTNPGGSHYGTPEVEALSQYYVDGIENDTFLPYTDGTSNWFINDPQTGYEPACDRDYDPYNPKCTTPPYFTGNDPMNFYRKVRDEELPYADMSDLSLWLAERQTLTAIVREGLINDPQWDDYWLDHINSSAGISMQLQWYAHNWKVAYQPLFDQMATRQIQLDTLLSLKQNTPKVDSGITLLVLQLDKLYMEYYANFSILLQDMQQINNAMPANHKFEVNEKKVNALLLSKLQAPTFPFQFTSTELELLEKIAAACPNEGGPSVYTARGVLLYLDGKRVFKDDEKCQGREEATSQRSTLLRNTESDLAIYPNPSKGDFTISWKQAAHRLALTDVSGRIVWENRLAADQTMIRFGEQLRPGVYAVQLYGNSGALLASKPLVVVPR